MTFDIGKALSRAFALLSVTGGQLLIAATLTSIAPLLLYYYAAELPTGYVNDGFGSWVDNPLIGLPKLILDIVVNVVFSTAVIATVSRAEGAAPTKRATLWQELVTIVSKRFWTVLGVFIAANFLIGMATIFLVVPGIIVALMFCVALPAAIIESRDVGESLTRSRDLTRGHRWRLLIYFLVPTALTVGYMIIIYQSVVISDDIPSWWAPVLVPVYMITDTLLATVLLVFITAAYISLRDMKEGQRPDSVADVFT